MLSKILDMGIVLSILFAVNQLVLQPLGRDVNSEAGTVTIICAVVFFVCLSLIVIFRSKG